jgi:chromosomal replication initiator protein
MSPQEEQLERIKKAVARHFKLKLTDLAGPRRLAKTAWARQVGMYLARHLNNTPYQTIGKAFGGRDHGTVIYACRKVAERTKINAEDAQSLQILTEALTNTLIDSNSESLPAD